MGFARTIREPPPIPRQKPVTEDMPDMDDTPYLVVERRGSSLGAFLGGAVLGAAVALLYAPKSGEETQADLREGLRRLRDDAETRLDDAKREMGRGYDRVRDEVSTRIDTAREDLRQRRTQAEEAVRAGREAARKAREDLDRRVTETKQEYREKVAQVAEDAADAADDIAEAARAETDTDEVAG